MRKPLLFQLLFGLLLFREETRAFSLELFHEPPRRASSGLYHSFHFSLFNQAPSSRPISLTIREAYSYRFKDKTFRSRVMRSHTLS